MLTSTGCRGRQQRLRRALVESKIDAAVISDPHEIYYFTGVLLPTLPPALPGLLWIDAHSTCLIGPSLVIEAAVDELLTYHWNHGFTANADWMRCIDALLRPRLSGLSAARLGWQAEALPRLLGATIDSALHPDEWIAIDELISGLERRKDPDEIDLIRHSIAINLAAYHAVQEVIQPGVREIDVLAVAQQAATSAAGEPVYHNGDYASGEQGGWARNRPIKAGELYVVDAWTYYRGYWSDMSRSFVVGDSVTDLQQSIFDHIKQVHEVVPELLKPGVDGSEVWRKVDALIREHPALAATGLVHHAGHNLGLRAHEMPDLNPDRGGLLEVGNVIAVEPGAYLDAVHVRLENMYLLTDDGVENLSVYPMSLR